MEPLIRGMDPWIRIRIHSIISRIRNTDNNLCRTRRRMRSWQPCRKKRKSERRRRKRSRTTRRSWNGSVSGTTGRTITDAARAIGKIWVDKDHIRDCEFFCVMLKIL